MKKSILLLFAALLPLVASAHDFEVNGIYYNITSEEATTAEVTFKGDSYDSYNNEYSGSITIPATVTYNGVNYSVTSIGNFAFWDCSSLTAITLPEGVTSIGKYAFRNCSSLTDITLPEGVTSIGDHAFLGCSSLTAITLPEGVTSIGSFAFRYCSSLAAITIPEGVTSIGEGAFEGCSSLTAINIPEGVTSIGDNAFWGCSGLTAIIVEEGNEVYDSRNGCNAIIETNSNTLIQGCSTTIIPASVTRIETEAFRGCSSLTAITLPESVKSIGGDAFYYCTSLKSITIPEGVTYIGSGAFSYCSSLTAIIVEEGNEVYDSRNGCNAIIETNSNTLIQGCSTTIIPEGVTSIGWSAFEGCSSLTAIAIPEGVTSIGNYAFWDCSSLTAITIPEGVTYIGEIAFQGCSSLTAITIPEGVTSFGIRTFKDCSSLTSITIPEGVTSIEHWAFYQCSSLTSITCKAVTPPTCSSDAFYGVDKSIPVYVPAGSVEAYKVAEGWSEFTNISMSVPITHITLSQSSATLTEGEDLTLTMTTNPENADRNLISWSSSNPCVATVDGQGKVTAQAPGTAIITATATDGSGASASCKVEVVAAQQHFYTITFLVDGKVYHQESLEYGSAIVAPEAPTKEGYTFSGWGEVAETVPAYDVTYEGSFSVNSYLLTYMVDGEIYLQTTVEYGSAIVAPEAPTKEGYTFGGWSEVPETMLAGDVTITGSFTINKYVVTFKVGDEVIASDSLEYNTAIIAPEVPEREGHTFSGWGEVAETVPAYDVTYEGSFSVNSYLLTYMVDGEIYLQTTVEYGSAIVAPEAPTKEGYTFSGWSNVPETMPAGDVTVTGTFTAEEQPETEIIASGTCGDSLTWVLTEEYELVIEGTGAMYDYAANNVPWSDYRKSIQAVSLSEEMTSIGDYAFSNCTKLVAIAIPESVTSIGYRAFYRCSKLATVTITEESQLTSIGYAAFESCSKLTDITIPCGVTSIGEYAFFSCRKLTSITCYATTPPTIGGISTFYSVDKTIPVYVLDYTIAAYQSAKHWSEFTWFIGMETGINNSEIKNQKSDIIYDLHGRRITDTEGLKGIYIIDGRKVIIK